MNTSDAVELPLKFVSLKSACCKCLTLPRAIA